jgi:hypothetical protein
MVSALERPSWLPLVDLRGITRDADIVQTHIEVQTPQGYFPWLRFGSLSRIDLGENHSWIGARMKVGVTDMEHDSAYALRFEVTHVKLLYVTEGTVVLEACIAGANDDARSFNVPSASIDKVDLIPRAQMCEVCKGQDEDSKPHLITDFTPKFDDKHEYDPVLWKNIRGCRIRITLGPISMFDGE